MRVDKEQRAELMTLYNELKSSGLTSLSTGELERFTELFTLSLPRSEYTLVRVEQL